MKIVHFDKNNANSMHNIIVCLYNVMEYTINVNINLNRKMLKFVNIIEQMP